MLNTETNTMGARSHTARDRRATYHPYPKSEIKACM